MNLQEESDGHLLGNNLGFAVKTGLCGNTFHFLLFEIHLITPEFPALLNLKGKCSTKCHRRPKGRKEIILRGWGSLPSSTCTIIPLDCPRISVSSYSPWAVQLMTLITNARHKSVKVYGFQYNQHHTLPDMTADAPAFPFTGCSCPCSPYSFSEFLWPMKLITQFITAYYFVSFSLLVIKILLSQ